MSEFRSLSSGLQSVYEQRSTGKLSVVGKHGKGIRVGTIMLRKGQVVDVKYREKRGDEALKFLLTFDITQALFFKSPVANSDNAKALPSTADLLRQLDKDGPQPELN